MSSRVVVRVFADYPRQMMSVGYKGNGGHAKRIREICSKHGLKFKWSDGGMYSDRLYIIADEKDMHKLGPALVEVMETGVSLTL